MMDQLLTAGNRSSCLAHVLLYNLLGLLLVPIYIQIKLNIEMQLNSLKQVIKLNKS
jgi:hypothetical protein